MDHLTGPCTHGPLDARMRRMSSSNNQMVQTDFFLSSLSLLCTLVANDASLLFNQLDANSDGTISVNELWAKSGIFKVSFPVQPSMQLTTLMRIESFYSLSVSFRPNFSSSLLALLLHFSQLITHFVTFYLPD